MLTRRLACTAIALVPILGAIPVVAQEKVKAVATFSILADFVRQVGGERVATMALVGPNGDAHVYEPSPADARRVAGAAVVFANGMGFDGWIPRLVRASGSHAPVVVASQGVTPLKADNGHGHGGADPHAWQSVANAKIYVANIRDGLARVDPAGREDYAAAAAAYAARLDALEQEVKAAIARIPADRRKVITTHAAFRYFEQAYGIAFIAPQGVSTESEASARDVARIITQIRRQNIPAVFLENVTDPRLSRRIAEETAAKIGGTLHSDALTGADGPAPTYIDMIRHNVRALGAALGG